MKPPAGLNWMIGDPYINLMVTTCWVYRGGLPGILTFGVGWGGDDNVPCNCTHLGATQLLFLALAHISMLRNWCFLHLHTSRCYATDVSCTCTHLDATQLMFLALAHISVLRNWCFLQLHTSRCYATDVSCTCTHLGATQLMFLARAHIWVLRNWCFWHLHTSRRYAADVFFWQLHTSRCYATDVPCTCTHLDATQLIFSATGCTKSNCTMFWVLWCLRLYEDHLSGTLWQRSFCGFGSSKHRRCCLNCDERKHAARDLESEILR